MSVEPDCEDQALFETKVCTQCRIGLDEDGKPIYAGLVKVDRVWVCSQCQLSYGEHPHRDLR